MGQSGLACVGSECGGIVHLALLKGHRRKVVQKRSVADSLWESKRPVRTVASRLPISSARKRMSKKATQGEGLGGPIGCIRVVCESFLWLDQTVGLLMDGGPVLGNGGFGRISMKTNQSAHFGGTTNGASEALSTFLLGESKALETPKSVMGRRESREMDPCTFWIGDIKRYNHSEASVGPKVCRMKWTLRRSDSGQL